jgi:hypothetical protein
MKRALGVFHQRTPHRGDREGRSTEGDAVPNGRWLTDGRERDRAGRARREGGGTGSGRGHRGLVGSGEDEGEGEEWP